MQNLDAASDHVGDANFRYHDVPGGHDYTVASIGLYNFLRLGFAK